MQTEATHVTRMKNRRRVIMMIIPGAISQRGIKRTPDEAAINSQGTECVAKESVRVKHTSESGGTS